MHRLPIEENTSTNEWERREFVTTVMTAIGASLIIPNVAFAKNTDYPLTVQQIIELILNSVSGAPFKETVDTIKSGDPAQQVTGIVTTMFATDEVIGKTAKLGANFIIAHEPTFYNHTDETGWLQNDAVYKHKKELLENNKIVVWRFHDYIHAHKPDGILMGVLNAVGWEKYYDASNPYIINIQPASFAKIIELSKKRLGIPHVKVIGNPSQICSKIILIPGAAGGRLQISALQKEKPDLLIVGEINEWETSEYIRDMQYTGGKTSLLVLGHIVSEEPGLEWLVQWLQPQIPNITITHIPSTDPFMWV